MIGANALSPERATAIRFALQQAESNLRTNHPAFRLKPAPQTSARSQAGRQCHLGSHSADEVRRVTSHFFAVEDVDHAKLLDAGITELRQR